MAVSEPNAANTVHPNTCGRSAAEFVWCDAQGEGRNVFVLFRRGFELSVVPSAAEFNVFADSRYRLRVNGVLVGCGPAAFLVRYPEYDRHDLARYLRVGPNVITVEVNARGDNSFQAEPSYGGFIAWGGAGDVSFATPGAWRARRCAAWSQHAPAYSFAQSAVEILDLNALPEEWFDPAHDDGGWPAAVRHGRPEHWGQLELRTVPMPTWEPRRPARVRTLGPLASTEERLSVHRVFRDLPFSQVKDRHFAYRLILRSPSHQRTSLAAASGAHWLNGRRLQGRDTSERPLRQDFEITLQAGDNLLYGEMPIIGRSWGMILSWSRRAGLTLPESMLLSPVHSAAELAAQRDRHRTLGDPTGAPRWMQPADAYETSRYTGREVCWDDVLAEAVAEPRRVTDLVVPRSAEGEGCVVFDFEGEFLGHVELVVDAPEGGILDVTNDERLRSDGAIFLMRANPLINSVDRFHLRRGENRITGFHPRGGRYLQVTVRSAGPVTIRQVAVRDALVPVPVSGHFECTDELFNWTWTAGVETLRCSLTDGWVDPWREQGMYLGDVLVQQLAHQAWTADSTHGWRSLRLWARAQLRDGQLQPCVPSWLTRAHADYTLMLPILLGDHVRHTGDFTCIAEFWPCIDRIFASPVFAADRNGLWSGEGVNVFGDWGAAPEAVGGQANGILNAFRIGALRAASELGGFAGDLEREEAYASEAGRVAADFRAALWDPETQAFASARVGNARVTTGAGHANVLALLYGIATPAQEAGALALVRRTLAAAAAAPEKCVRRGGHFELYFLHYVLEMLAARGLHAEAEAIITTFWGLQRRHGAWTLWEAFYRGLVGDGSWCHGWAAGPNHYFHRHTLGIEVVGDRVVVEPNASRRLEGASGRRRHPRGMIDVSWRVRGAAFEMEVTLPPGVSHTVRPGSNFAHLQPRVNVQIRGDRSA